MKQILFVTFYLTATLNYCFAGDTKFEFPVKIAVTDDNGKAVKDSGIRLWFVQSRVRSADPSILVTGKTDENGIFATTHKGNGKLSLKVKKDGYYEWSDSKLYFFKNPKEDFIRPYNPMERPIQVLLRKINNPIPMYVKRVEMSIPKLEKPIGFDLMEGDWVSPYGTGKHTDVSLTIL